MDDPFYEHLHEILNFYRTLGSDLVMRDQLFSNGNEKEMVFDRLLRAVMDQGDKKCIATDSRYAIWASDIKQILLDAELQIKEGNHKEAIKDIYLAINALSAYIDIKALYDAKMGMQFETPEKIISRYKSLESKIRLGIHLPRH